MFLGLALSYRIALTNFSHQQSAKIGLGVSIEAAPEELQDQQEALGSQPPPNIPF